ncbi:MAG: hypothetical protein IKZ87_00145 [Actinomycetaceae bacterium]|nr:hypothetical protein [Actinomycetaceae bacterium]
MAKESSNYPFRNKANYVFAPEKDVEGAGWDAVEFQGKMYQIRYYTFLDDDGCEIDGYAALEDFQDVLLKDMDFVSDEAQEIDCEVIGVYVPREIFYADEETFINHIKSEHYDCSL